MRLAAVLAIAIACLPCDAFAAPAGVARDASRLLAASRRALGGAAVERVRTISAVASVRAPDRAFDTRVVSDRGGRARMEQDGAFVAVVSRDGGTSTDLETRALVPLDAATRSVVRGHEVHMLTLFPTTRWTAPRALGRSDFEGEQALGVGFTDEAGAPVALYLSVRDTLPLGYDIENHSGRGAPRVRVVLSEWMPLDGVQLCREAVFVHGADRYRYTYIDLRINDAREREFSAPPWPAAPPASDPLASDSPRTAAPRVSQSWGSPHGAPRDGSSPSDSSAARSDAASTAHRRDADVLLKLHRAVLDAHLRQDANAIVDREADDYVIANRGVVSTPTREERRARFAAYLGSTRFSEYRDLIDPIVRISEDGKQGWVVAQVFATGTQDDGEGGESPIEFTCAWIELYEKRAGRWVRVGNVSNFKEPR